jgi:hypothetical protein
VDNSEQHPAPKDSKWLLCTKEAAKLLGLSPHTFVEPVGMWLSSQAYASYRPPDYAPAERELSARRSGRLTFGCFNNFAKIKDQVIELWAEILYAAPGARLLRCRSPFRQKINGPFGRF